MFLCGNYLCNYLHEIALCAKLVRFDETKSVFLLKIMWLMRITTALNATRIDVVIWCYLPIEFLFQMRPNNFQSSKGGRRNAIQSLKNENALHKYLIFLSKYEPVAVRYVHEIFERGWKNETCVGWTLYYKP